MTITSIGAAGAEGYVSGAISPDQFICDVAPALASAFAEHLQSQRATQNEKDALRTFFDLDKDDRVTSTEIVRSIWFNPVCCGDIDVDGGKGKETSLRLSFKAMKATIGR